MNVSKFLKNLSGRFGSHFPSKFLPVAKIAVLLISLLLSSNSLFAKKIDVSQIRYEIEGAETGAEGTYLVKVLIYTNKPETTVEELKYAAVHGVIFRGFTRKGFGTQKPMSKPEIEKQKSDFFNAFWGNGDYLNFAEIVNPTAERIKISKKEYKIGAIISVAKDDLRKSLENAGIIKGLNSGF